MRCYWNGGSTRAGKRTEPGERDGQREDACADHRVHHLQVSGPVNNGAAHVMGRGQGL